MCPRSCALKLQGEGDDTTTFSETTLAVGCCGGDDDEEGDRFLPAEKERLRK
jgi:hypothetical protein